MAEMAGAMLGVLAILSIMRHSFGIDLAADVLLKTLDGYDALIDNILGWAEPYIVGVFSWLAATFHIDIRLFATWKSVVVLSLMLFRPIARESFARRDYAHAWLIVGLGTLGSVIVGIAVGSVPPDIADLESVSKASALPVLALWIVLGLATFLTNPPPSWDAGWDFGINVERGYLLSFATVIGIAWCVLQVPALVAVGSVYLLTLSTFVVLGGAVMLLVGLSSWNNVPEQAAGSIRIGATILAGFVFAPLTLAIDNALAQGPHDNAGWQKGAA